MLKSFYKSENKDFTLVQGDCIKILNKLDFKFDMIFADPPYFLSNGGISVQSGKQVLVNKGDWDKSQGFEKDNDFNKQWLAICREKLTDNGTIWVSGTFHNICKIGDVVEAGEEIAQIVITDGKVCPVRATISGILRGLLREGYAVTEKFKVADIDPRKGELENCFTISDKARCIAGSVLEVVVSDGIF